MKGTGGLEFGKVGLSWMDGRKNIAGWLVADFFGRCSIF